MSNKILTTAAGAAAMMMLSHAAQANTLVGSIVGAYDLSCGNLTCAPSKPAGISHFASNGIGGSDTPSLYIYNPNGTSMTNVKLVLTGYNGDNNGVTQTLTLPAIGANTVYQLVWGTGGTLFTNDYDDEKGHTVAGSGPVTPASGGSPVCASVGSGICSKVGNFDAQFSATLNGKTISSNFSDNAAGQNGAPSNYGNVPNVFVPWEGVSPQGWSESFADQHTGTTPGVLANIFTGSGQSGGTSVPEPTTVGLFGAGLAALAARRRRRKSE